MAATLCMKNDISNNVVSPYRPQTLGRFMECARSRAYTFVPRKRPLLISTWLELSREMPYTLLETIRVCFRLKEDRQKG